jgi:predicted  nucleic acid-binding Zn-ribbon protein
MDELNSTNDKDLSELIEEFNIRLSGEISEVEEEIVRLKVQIIKCEDKINEYRKKSFLSLLSNGIDGELKIDAEDSLILKEWVDAVNNNDAENMVGSAAGVRDVLMKLVLGESTFLKKPRRRGRPETTASNFNLWAYSEVYNVEAAAVEFCGSTGKVKKARSTIKKLPAYKVDGESTMRIARAIVKMYEADKISAEIEAVLSKMDKADETQFIKLHKKYRELKKKIGRLNSEI